MPQQLLDCPNVHPVLKQMRGERVPERRSTRLLPDPSPQDRGVHGPLDHGFVHMMLARTTLADS
jgi:hypothetical protein